MEKIKIWGKTIPFNSEADKFSDRVELWDGDKLWGEMQKYFAKGDDPNRDPDIRRQVIEQDEIGRYGASRQYMDEPYLIPFLKEGADSAVIIVPGGAYVMKSMEHEGTEVAELLNEEGISAFVLWYRTYPYMYPTAYLDVQRAIRYVRFHAGDLGIDPKKIAVMGFSAGGNAVAGAVNILKDLPVIYPGYEPDEVDFTSAKPAALALNYPALEVSRDPQALHMLSGKESYDNAKEEEAWIRRLDISQYLSGDGIPYFFSYGTLDTVVLPEGTKAFAEKLQTLGNPVKLLVIEGADHGYGSCVNPHRDAEFLAAGWHKTFAEWFLA